MCSRCGVLVEKDLSVRVHKCHTCGLEMDRDENAAINILDSGYNPWGLPLEATPFTGWSSHVPDIGNYSSAIPNDTNAPL